ncbi:MAG: M16 family metallopeptidase [Candidatus Aminicenantaceae bacterium]
MTRFSEQKINIDKKAFLVLCLTFLHFITVTPILAQNQEAFPLPISQYRLKNGLQVILSEDHRAPLVSVVVAYNVGSIDEQPGKTGLAYLLGNLMFQGSQNVSRMQHITYINRTGGTLNASTSEDKTLYYQTVPSNQLALVLWLESDRMRYLRITESNVERSKNSLIDEIQHRKATDLYLDSFFAFDQLIFPDFAYSHPVIGSIEDIRRITVEDVKKFYSTFYAPNNAVLCVVGNFNQRRAEELIKKYFESLPQGKELSSSLIAESIEKISTEKTLEDSLAPLPGYHLGFRIPSPYSNDYYAFKILEYILLRGNTSRLHERLYKKERIVYDYSGGIDKRRNYAVFKLFVLGSNEIVLDRSRRAISSEIDKLKSTPLSEKELTKSKNMFKMDYIKKHSTTQEKALFLTEAALSQIGLDELAAELQKYLDVKPADIIRITNKYFTSDNRVFLSIKIK